MRCVAFFPAHFFSTFYSRSLNVFFVILLAVSLASCKNKDYDIVLPIKNATFVGQLPEQFLIRYDVEPTKIMLNGIRVEQYFTFGDGVATVSGEVLEGFLIQGSNNISVDAHRFGPRRYFYFDDQGPRIVVTHISDDKPPVIQGELIDPSGAYGLTVNGSLATVARDGSFEVMVDPASMYEIVTEDRYAQVSTLHYAHRATIVPDIVKLQITQSGVDDLIPFAQELIEEQDLAALLGVANANTLFDEAARISLPKVVIIPRVCVPVIGCTPEVALGPVSFNIISVKGTLTTLQFQELEIDQLDLNSGDDWEGLSLDATLRGVDLGLRFETDVLGLSGVVKDLLEALGVGDDLGFLAGTFGGDISVSRLRLASDVGLSATDGDVNLNVVSIKAIGLGDADSDFVVDFQLPAAISNFGYGLVGKVVELIENGISAARDLIVDLLLGKLVPLIVNLVLDPLVNELQVRLGMTLNNGAVLTTFVGVSDVHVVDNNKLTMSLNGRVGAESAEMNGGEPGSIDIGLDLGFPEVVELDDHLLPDLLGIPEGLGVAPGIVPNALGFRYSLTDVPDPESFVAPSTELGVSVSSNLINQALLAIFEAGVLSPSIPIFDDRENSGAYFITDAESANERILFRPRVPPELTFRGDQISIAYLTLDHFDVIFQDLVEEEVWVDNAVYEINAELAVQLSNDSEEGLRLGLLNPDFDLLYEIGNNGQGRIRFPTRGLLLSALEAFIVEQINGGLRLVSLPAELQLGADGVTLGIEPGKIETVGEPREHFGISASFNAL